MMKFLVVAAVAAAGFGAYWFWWRERSYSEQAQDWTDASVDAVSEAVSHLSSAAGEYAGKARNAVGL